MYSEEEQEIVSNNGTVGNFYQNNKVLVWICIAVILIAIVIFFINKKSDNTSSSESVAAIKIYPENDVEISLGNSYKLLAVVNNKPDAVVVWTSSDENIAKVDNGQVTTLNYGKVTITATYVYTAEKKYEATKDIVVSEGKQGITLTDVAIQEGDLYMPVNGTYTISLNMTPPNGYISNKTFISSNESVVTVDNKGIVKSLSEGEATISININNSAFNKTLKAYVNKDYTNAEIIPSPTTITLNKESSKIKVGGSVKLNYTVVPTEARNSHLTWTSSDPSVLTVDNTGMITAVKEGKTTLKVESLNGISDSLEIEVIPDSVPVTDIQLSLTDIYIEMGQIQTLTPIVVPDTATDRTLKFDSSDTSIINFTPSSDGSSCEISGLSEGTATMTITDSSGAISKTINIIVTAPIDPGSGGSSGGGSSCKKTCPAGQYVEKCKCVTCPAGSYCRDGKKASCSSGYSSKEGASSCYRSSCPAGSYLDSSHSTGCRTCPSGKYCSGGTAMPKTCANGSVPNSGKTGCTACKINNCVTHGGGGTSCTCTKCQPNYVSQGSSCKYVGGSTSKPCSSRGTVGECNASPGCTWSYDKGCH